MEIRQASSPQKHNSPSYSYDQQSQVCLNLSYRVVWYRHILPPSLQVVWYWHTMVYSLLPFLPLFVHPTLLLSLSPSCPPPSLTPSFPPPSFFPSLPPSLPLSLPPSLLPYTPPSLPPYLPPSLPLSSLREYSTKCFKHQWTTYTFMITYMDDELMDVTGTEKRIR